MLTLAVISVGVWLVLRRSVAAPLPTVPTFDGEPAVVVMMIEPFLNHQLREALAIAESDPKGFSGARDTMRAMAENPSGLKPSRFKMKLNGATFDVQNGRRAKFFAQLTFTAWRFNVQLRPIAEMVFGLQDGRVKIAVTNVEVGGFNVPRALIERFVSEVVATAEVKLNHSLAQLQQDTGVQLAGIETTEDLLVLKFAERA
ncbi:MAG: hypothetical protein HY741_24095 [Chloroflexi bacterium]|nr:hypothetical protein [Chloroflexota bacterium]